MPPVVVTTIRRIETCDVRVPLARLSSDAINMTDAWGFAVVRLHTADGLVGTGYMGVARGLGSDLVLDGGGNRASGNAISPQCQNVICSG